MFNPCKGHLEREQPYLGDLLTMLINHLLTEIVLPNHVLTEIVLQEPRPALLKNSWNRLAHRQPVVFLKKKQLSAGSSNLFVLHRTFWQ